MTQIKARPRKTVEDFTNLPEGVRAEFIEGEIFMSPSPREKHQRVSVNLTRILSTAIFADRISVTATKAETNLSSLTRSGG